MSPVFKNYEVILELLSAAEPVCCGAPMVHNSATGEYECADAYFALYDDGLIGDYGLLVHLSELNDYERERYEHWRDVRVPDAGPEYEPRGD
jgi:hypothetical protein